MDFGRSDEVTIKKGSTTARSQDINTGSPTDRKIKERRSYFFTFFTFMLAVLPQVRSGSSPAMSGISAPLACRKKKKGKKMTAC